jgi:HD-like signal output (HDOD) protein
VNRGTSIDDLLDQVGVLPPMPLVARKATEIINNTKSNMADLANVIKLDPSISGLILRWVNSAYYGLTRPVVSIEQAVTFLGQRTVQNLVLSASIASFMGRSLPGYDLKRGDLWKHAIGTAAGARLIACNIVPRMAEDGYYAGLFCDVGKLAFDVLMQGMNLDYEAVIAKQQPFPDFERGIFGYEHAEMSAAMAQRWHLPDHLISIIRYHHTPAEVEVEWRPLAYAVHAADAAMMMLGIGIGVDGLLYPLDPDTVNMIKWDEATYGSLVERIVPIIDETEAFLMN